MINISLESTTATSVQLSQKDDIESNEVKLSFESEFDTKQKRTFYIKFHIVTTTTPNIELSVDYSAKFKTDGDIDDQFKKSDFVKINSPAIAYPFLRSFIANTLLSAGYEPLILPAVNFTNAFN